MKIQLSILMILVFTICAFGQDAKTTDSSALTKEEAQIYGELLSTKLKLGLCGMSLMNTAQKAECADFNTKLGNLYLKVSKSPRLINTLMAQAVIEYESIREQANSAPQISQIADEQNVQLNRIIVIQNQRIIELLEKLTKGK